MEGCLIGCMVADSTNTHGCVSAPRVIARSLHHAQYTSTIGYDGFSPANYVVNGLNPRPMCEANSFSKCIMGKTVPGYILQSVWTFLNHHTGNGSCTVLLKSANLSKVSYLSGCFWVVVFFLLLSPCRKHLSAILAPKGQRSRGISTPLLYTHAKPCPVKQ